VCSKADGMKQFDLDSAKRDGFGLIDGEEFMQRFLGKSASK